MPSKEFFYDKAKSAARYFAAFSKWAVIAAAIGICGGLIGTFFHMALNMAADIFSAHRFMLWLLPAAGVLIVFLYHIAGITEDAGTNLIITSVRGKNKVPIVVAPLIFISSFFTHVCGGSAGREGAALQLGGAIGAKTAEVARLDEKDRGLAVMCGMSAVFSALFGTPVTACFFAMEVISVGIIYYAGFVPCLISALTACKISMLFGIAPSFYDISGSVPGLSLGSAVRTGALAALCAGVSILFCAVMEFTAKKLRGGFENQYARILIGAAAVILMTFAVGTYDYNGAGTAIITAATEEGSARWWDFALKMVFTAVTIGAGFKGGEIVPTLFIGSTFGCCAGELLGLDPRFGAAVGMVALFCGVVNCPAAAVFLSLELFGGGGIALFAAASAVSYMLSGYYGLYSGQKIVYSKTAAEYININAK